MFWHLYSAFSVYLLSHVSSVLSAKYPCDYSCQLTKYKINHQSCILLTNPYTRQKRWSSHDVKENMWCIYCLKQSIFERVSLLRINRKEMLSGKITAFLCLCHASVSVAFETLEFYVTSDQAKPFWRQNDDWHSNCA